MSNVLKMEKSGFDLSPKNLDEAMRFADILASSEIVPKDFRGKSGNILVAIQWGMELGLKPMQAMQNIAVINGRPALWGDAVLALVQGSSVCQSVVERIDGDIAICEAHRKGQDKPQIRTFSVDDAKKAGLFGKQGPWTQYPKRMLQLRARAFALRDVFADVLSGISIAEEVMDYTDEKDITPQTDKKPLKEAYPQERFDKNLPLWSAGIKNGKVTKKDCLATIRSKFEPTEEQVKLINEIEGTENEDS